jgi:hypothetical protein
MTTVFEKTYLLLTEIEERLIPTKDSKRRRGVLYATTWALEAITEVSMATQDWTADPKPLLAQLVQEFEELEKLRWGIRICEIMKEI